MPDIFPFLSQEEFNEIINPLGPWGDNVSGGPPVAIAVSGGADSMCLALLASRWRKNVFALIVDHQIRPDSTREARLTQQRLSALSIPSRILTLTGLDPGAALEERARGQRYQVLIDACYEMGCVDLLLGHHAGDQAETVLMRIRAGSGHDGLAAMAQITELPKIRLVRPFLSIAPQRLRKTLQKNAVHWIEDPSNQDMRFQRNQIRNELKEEWRISGSISMLLRRSVEEGINRMEKDQAQAEYLIRHVRIMPEGFAVFSQEGMDERTLGALIRTVSGSVYTPLQKSLDKLVKSIRKITLGGVQIIPAGRLGEGWLMIREEAAIEPPKKALPGQKWDQRFQLDIPEGRFRENITIKALGNAYRQFSDRQGLPVSILKTLPSLWQAEKLVAIPHLGICLDRSLQNWRILFQPKQPVTQTHLFSTIKID